MGLALGEPQDTDQTFDFDEIKIVIENELLSKAGKITIGYAQNPHGEGFELEWANPLLPGAGPCDCGSCSC